MFQEFVRGFHVFLRAFAGLLKGCLKVAIGSLEGHLLRAHSFGHSLELFIGLSLTFYVHRANSYTETKYSFRRFS